MVGFNSARTFLALFIFIYLSAPLAVSSAYAATFQISSISDGADAAVGDGECKTTENVCTLQAAIEEANALQGDDIVSIPAGIYSLTSRLVLNSNITLVGAGSSATFIQQTVSDLVIEIPTSSATSINIEKLTIQNGAASAFTGGGGISAWNSGCNVTLKDVIVQNNKAGDGAGISNSTNLTLIRTIVRDNENFSDQNSPQFRLGGGIYHSVGQLVLIESTVENNKSVSAGGIFNMGRAKIVSSTINNNVATNNGLANSGNGGGGIVNGSGSEGTIEIVNSTISGNKAFGFYGGLFNEKGTMQLSNVTVTENIADSDGDGFGDGGGVGGEFALFTAKNSIIAGNLSNGGPAKDCLKGNIASGGYNLIGVKTGCVWYAATGDDVGSTSAPKSPMLAPLADNGGATKTHAVLAHSPVIDTANPSGCSNSDEVLLVTDQRGIERSVDGGSGNARCDKGAFEFNSIIAVAGLDQAVRSGDLVTLDGSKSAPSASIVTYLWTQTSGEIVALTKKPVGVVTFTAPASGTLVFRLTVVDSDGNSNSDDVAISVATDEASPTTSKKIGGCVMVNGESEFDPVLLSILVLCAFGLWRRRQKGC